MSSTVERASDYRRTAERLRELSQHAKSEEAQAEFCRCARLYDRLAAASPANENGGNHSSPVNRRKKSSSPSSANSD